MNKKGMAQYLIFLVFIVAMGAIVLGGGAISGLLIKNKLAQIPWWGWFLLFGFILLVLRRKK